MPQIPDLSDPRYLDEIGWFLHHEKYRRHHFGGTYGEERLAYSRMLLDEVLSYCGQDQKWLEDKMIVTIGCGCTGDIAAWPAALKIAVDPLLYVYQKLRMLIEEVAGASPTIYLAVGVEDMPLLDDCADLVLCRNALDHMPNPEAALKQIARILRKNGLLFLSVDIGGAPTPDEPTVFSLESLSALMGKEFDVLIQTGNHRPHSKQRVCSVRILVRKRYCASALLNKDAVLKAYLARRGEAEVTPQGGNSSER